MRVGSIDNLVIVVASVGMVSLSGTMYAQQAPSTPPIAGAWILDTGASDAPTPVETPEMPGRPPGGGHTGSGGGRPPGGGGMGLPGGGHIGGSGGEGKPNEEQMRQRRDMLRELLEPSTRLTIVVSAREVAITDARGRTQRFATNGVKEKHQLNAGTIETKTRWNGAQLVKDVAAGDGMKLVETYAVDPATGQLHLTLKFEGGRMPERSVDRVYDPALETAK